MNLGFVDQDIDPAELGMYACEMNKIEFVIYHVSSKQSPDEREESFVSVLHLKLSIAIYSYL